ncbi:hypothetical protein [Cupriavidus lacunae]|uniref:Polyphosphate kinase-2-related domain-containing protein n=1 Tax=Cupriavidus lacunae TaxID=2666307 RepID=A0A370NPY9_9BURK|nr:hypothetical protein [Cupriavidus lacunae]RDK07680.1 hypothetical protein DN412_24950 [Cupriavidus lacunae]
MTKKKEKRQDKNWSETAPLPSDESRGKEPEPQARERMAEKAYRKELFPLHVELVKLQQWVQTSGTKVCVVFEGRDGAGKGGTVKAIKIWKLTNMDLRSYSRWYDYSRARDAMFAASDSDYAPWHVVNSNDKGRARLNIITHMLGQIPYKAIERKPVKLPARQKRGEYREPSYPYRYVEERY